MFTKLLLVGLLVFSFAAGYFFGLPNEDRAQSLEQQNQDLNTEIQRLSQRNQQLEQTLDLVKRQIQTDRIAYDSLRKTVDLAEQERAATKQKLESQRELLERLKKKLEE